eukprot:SAG22_NODE_13258_length_412_cov_1.146965_1_plen_93_part_10
MAIAQRVLAARSLKHARAACLLAAFLKITPVFILCYPGIIGRALFGDCVAGASHSLSGTEDNLGHHRLPPVCMSCCLTGVPGLGTQHQRRGEL